MLIEYQPPQQFDPAMLDKYSRSAIYADLPTDFLNRYYDKKYPPPPVTSIKRELPQQKESLYSSPGWEDAPSVGSIDVLSFINFLFGRFDGDDY